MPHGYMGRILEVDLDKEKYYIKELCMDTAKKYLGGKGYALWLIYEWARKLEQKHGSLLDLDAFHPDNLLVIATGPATGTLFPSSGRYHVMALKSPLTGSVASANSGGFWGPYLKYAGFDIIVVKGAAEKPVYLWIDDGKVEFRDATHLWGRTVFEATRAIKEEVYNKDAKVLTIGPAGENKVRFAAIMNDEHRAAGRTGVGAVMGSKKLKAIAVYGTQKIPVEKPDELRTVAYEMIQRLRKNPVTGSGLPKYGTAVLVNIINEAGMFPTKNFQTGVHPYGKDISGETLAEKYLVKNHACWGCTIACARATRVETGPYKVTYSEGPEYESIWALGASTFLKELDAIVKANHLADEFGLDTISLGATIAAAMELVEKGKIPEEKLDGIDLRFGNASAVVDMVYRIAYRIGIGNDLAEGSYRLGAKYGMPEVSMSVKKLELPAYDPRGAKGIGLNYATANRGGCHVTGYTISPEVLGLPEKIDRFTPEGKAKWVKLFQDFTSTVNSTVACLFVTFELGPADFAKLLTPITGWELTENDILVIGERIYNLERYIMTRFLGLSRKDDTLPRRLLEEPMPEGPSKGHVVELDKMLDEYYKLRGWKDGKPTPEKLKELGIPVD